MKLKVQMRRAISILLSILLCVLMCEGTGLQNGLWQVHAENIKESDTGVTSGDTEDLQAVERIQIASVEDLIELAKRCTLDAASEHMEVTLVTNLELTGIDFDGIRVFAGVFDGQGHTISGYSIQGDGYADGFFRYIAKSGVIRNTTFVGSCGSENVDEFVGGICGINRGLIENCFFKGLVEGEAGVGGICGENTSLGTLRGCYSSGVITGSTQVGGIVGVNHGIVDTCLNKASVDAQDAWIEEQDADGLEWVKNLLETETVEVRTAGVTDVGGVCGYSDGLMTDCMNSGMVGYAHSGYNIGGICGRQAGVMLGCTNNGIIRGRKDVGGIVGQMEPYIAIDATKSVKDDVKELHRLVDQFLDDLEASERGISADMDALREQSDAALSVGETLSDQLIDFTNENITSVNDMQERIEYVLRELPNATAQIQNALDMTGTIHDDLKKVTEDLDIVDQLENQTYNEANHKRLSLVTGVGGYLQTNIASPAQGDSVCVSAQPDNGYRLQSVAVKKADGSDVSYQLTGNDIHFTMPEPNVVVYATFAYVGAYVSASNEGGRVYASEENGRVKIRVNPESGYTFATLYVGADAYPLSAFALDDGEYILEVPAAYTGKPVLVHTTFTKTDVTYQISTVMTTGGYLTTDCQTAAAGDEVKITVHETSGYAHALPELSTGGTVTATGTLNEYAFTMPASDVKVSVRMTYQAEPDSVYAESTPGGSVTVMPVIGSNNYIVTLLPASGYEVAASTALEIYGNGTLRSSVPLADLSGEGTYTYTFNGNDYAKPIKVVGYFTTAAAGSYAVSKVDGTGGAVLLQATTAAPGDTIVFTAMPENGYRLTKLQVTNIESGVPVTYVAEAADNTYSYVQPAGNVQVVAAFEPVMVIVESNAGGGATYTATGNRVKLVVSPDTGYALDGNPKVTDASGKAMMVSKKAAGSSVYEFAVDATQEPVHVQLTFKKTTDYQTVQDAEDRISDNATRLENTMSDMQNTVSALEDLLTDADGNPLSYEDIIGDSEKTRALSELLVDLASELADAGEESAAIISSLTTIVSVLKPYVTDAIKNARKDMETALDDTEKMAKYLEDAVKVVDRIVDNLNARAELRFSTLPEEFSDDVDDLFDKLHRISDVMGRLTEHADAYTTKLTNDMRAINDKLNEILETVIDWVHDADDDVQDLRDRAFGKEMTDEEIELATTGKVKGCLNHGSVEGDINVGGITGSMAIDEEDPEGNAAGGVDWSILNSYHLDCVLMDCENDGNIVAKKDGSASIVGYMALGTVLGCKAYGSVKSTEGSYVGGICGQSRGAIRDCYSLCDIETDGSYVGGICGYGTIVRGCTSMTLIHGDAKNVGQIAGQIYVKEEEEGVIHAENVCDNVYVSSQYYGIDDISYVGIAEPLTYDELLALEGVPNAFRHLKVIFVVDGDIMRTQEVAYGTKLSDIVLPEVPQKDGQYGRWEAFDIALVEGNPTVNAEYFSSITTLQSENGVTDEAYLTMRDMQTEDEDFEDQPQFATKPYALLDGVFDDSLSLHAQKEEVSVPEAVIGKHPYIAYHVWIEGAKESLSATKLRLYHEYEGEVKVYCLEGDTFREVPSVKYGSYVQVTFLGTEATYLIVSQKEDSWWVQYAFLGAVGVICILVLIFIVKLISGSRKKKKYAQQNSEKAYIEEKRKADEEKAARGKEELKENNTFLDE